MKIWKLVQTSYNDGKLTDFDVPKDIAHYTTEEGAVRGRDACVALNADKSEDDRTTTLDYSIFPIHVHEN